MKKFAKILGFSISSLLGLILLLICTMVWLVFTPTRLTPIVRQVADRVLLCEHEIGNVELTFFSTFPEFGLRLEGVSLQHACPGAASDTLFSASEMLATLDVRALLNQRHLKVRELAVRDANAYIYMADSLSNLQILSLPADTASESDTAVAALPFDSITVEQLFLSARQLVLDDQRDSLLASLADVQLSAHMHGWQDVFLLLSCPQVHALLGQDVYADSLSLQLSLPLSLDTELQSVELYDARLQVNQLSLLCDGIVSMADSLSMQLTAELSQWPIHQILTLVPAHMQHLLADVQADGLLSLQADIAGVLSDSVMPQVDAHLVLEQGSGAYAALPYKLRDIALDLDAHLDLNQPEHTTASIHRLVAKTQHSSFTLSGKVLQPLTDMLLQLRLGANVYMPEFADLLPEDMQLHGRVKANMNLQARLEDLMAMHLDQTRLSGKLHLYDFIGDFSDMELSTPEMHIAFALPHAQPVSQQMAWANASISFTQLEFSKTTQLYAGLGDTDIDLSLSNILQDKALWHVDIALQSSGDLQAQMDTISARIAQPNLRVQLQHFNPNDSTAIPTALLSLSYGALKAFMGEDMAMDMNKTGLELALSPSQKDASIPYLMASINTEALHAQMDSTLDVQAHMLAMAGATQYNKHADNLLLKLNPQLQVNMLDGYLQTDMLPLPVVIPHIDFAYDNRQFHIENSQVQLGNSDFNLSGDVRNIAAWLNEEGDLQGELNFESSFTDANELMALFSASAGSEEIDATSASSFAANSSTQEPFLVPTNLSLTLNTNIEEARVFEENLRSLHGKLYVDNGVLILDEMGFICKAAQLQLTAMYRTPRRNHIYMGLDYHMIDIKIEELVRMLPQLDTIVPMLSSFRGEAEFHLAAETYLTSDYKIKPSTLRGACSLAGKDLVVMDSETFSTLSKKLMFSKKTENIVDSISAEMTIYKKEIDLYPLCLSMDNYTVALGGRHNLDMTFDYDVNVLSPIYLGVNVSGSIGDLKIKPTKCKFAKDFRPIFHGKTNQQSAQLRAVIRESMRKNLRIQSQSNSTNQQ